MNVYYSVDGTAASVPYTASSYRHQRVDKSKPAPLPHRQTGITSGNTILACINRVQRRPSMSITLGDHRSRLQLRNGRQRNRQQ